MIKNLKSYKSGEWIKEKNKAKKQDPLICCLQKLDFTSKNKHTKSEENETFHPTVVQNPFFSLAHGIYIMPW